MRTKAPPKTQQTARTRPESVLSIPQTLSSTLRSPGNFWAASTPTQSNLNLFINNYSQKPTSSIFLTSKQALLPSTPQRQYANPLLRKFSEPLCSDRPSSTEEPSPLRKVCPLTLRENNSRFYQKLRKAEDDQKIASNRLILDSYGLQAGRKKPERSKDEGSFRVDLRGGVKSKERPLQEYNEDYAGRASFAETQHSYFQKGIEVRSKLQGSVKTPRSSSQEDRNDAGLSLRGKFKVKTFLTQREELRLKGRKNDFREVQKKLVVPRLYEKAGKETVKWRFLLVVENLYLSECKSRNSLKYCYLRLPIPLNSPVLPSLQIEAEFIEILRVLKEKFNINAKTPFLFLPSGREVKSHYDIPPSEHTIFISGNKLFLGVNKSAPRDTIHGFLLLKTLKNLEKPIRDQETAGFQPISVEKHIRMNYGDVVDEVIGIFGREGGDRTSQEMRRLEREVSGNRWKGDMEESGEVCERSGLKNGKLNYKDLGEYMDASKSGLPLIYSKKFDDVCQICEIYDRNADVIRFDKVEKDDEDCGATLELENVKNLEAKEMRKMANYLDYLLEKWMNPRKKVVLKGDCSVSKSQKDESIMIDLGPEGEKESRKRDFLKENKGNFETKKGYIRKLTKRNKEIFLQNIPKLLKRTNFTRRELHGIYILYKALQEVTSQRYEKYNLDEGLDYYTFRNGIYQMFVQSEGLATMIFNTIDFNFSGFLNWEEFLNLMVIIKAKTLREKIDLFIKIADEDGNGMLSKTEIFNLCKICLSKFISEKEEDHFLDDLCSYFTKLIFGAVNIDIEDEIPLTTIKEAILSGNEESDLLAMFCGADM